MTGDLANPGLLRSIVTDVLSTPANDIDAAAKVFERHNDDLSAVIVEPVMGGAGIVPIQIEFLNYLAGKTQSSGAFQIFDEVITFLLACGGGHGLYSLRPDLKPLGKIIVGPTTGHMGFRGDTSTFSLDVESVWNAH